jgi:hypothetical protein
MGRRIADVHAKIRTVAEERGEAPGLTEPIFISGATRPAFSTAITGGLANYWGQQFVRYSAKEPWPDAVFDQYQQYQTACSKIESEFQFDEMNGPIGPNRARLGVYEARSPRLLVGTKQERRAGLLSMRRLIEQKLAEQQATKIEARVDALMPKGKQWAVKLSDGSTVFANRVVLASGVLGTASLLMRSFPDIKSVRLRDHTPLMLYTYGLERIVNTRRHGPDRHFNVQTLQRDLEDEAVLFATIYNMRYAEINLILVTLLNRFVPFLAGRHAPWPADWIKPVQVWTRSTVSVTEIHSDGSRARVVDRPPPEGDAELAAFMKTLRENGVRVLKISEAPPLLGFHYFGLEILADDERYVPIEHFLDRRTMRQVLCVDPSILRRVGCRPHTETAMATALKLASDLE